MSLVLLGASVAALTGCGEGRNGVYLGTVTTTQADGSGCGLSAAGGVMRGSLSVRGEGVLFAPETGVVAMPGRIDKAGHIMAGNTLAGADHKPFPMAFDGDLRDGRVTGVYATPRCRASVALARPG